MEIHTRTDTSPVMYMICSITGRVLIPTLAGSDNDNGSGWSLRSQFSFSLPFSGPGRTLNKLDKNFFVKLI